MAELSERCVKFYPALHTLPFDMAEFNPFAVTIRYDDWDEETSPELLDEVLRHAIQVRTVIRAAMPEEVGLSRDRSS